MNIRRDFFRFEIEKYVRALQSTGVGVLQLKCFLKFNFS